MRYLLEKYGFKQTGVIYIEDGSLRIGFHFAGE